MGVTSELDLFDGVFLGSHVTIILKNPSPGGADVAQGLFLESDPEWLYLGPSTDIGVTEAIKRDTISRVIMTDMIEEDYERPKESELN